jgi:hypothetical protein
VSEFILDPSLMLPIVTGVVNQVIYKNWHSICECTKS